MTVTEEPKTGQTVTLQQKVAWGEVAPSRLSAEPAVRTIHVEPQETPPTVTGVCDACGRSTVLNAKGVCKKCALKVEDPARVDSGYHATSGKPWAADSEYNVRTGRSTKWADVVIKGRYKAPRGIGGHFGTWCKPPPRRPDPRSWLVDGQTVTAERPWHARSWQLTDRKLPKRERHIRPGNTYDCIVCGKPKTVVDTKNEEILSDGACVNCDKAWGRAGGPEHDDYARFVQTRRTKVTAPDQGKRSRHYTDVTHPWDNRVSGGNVSGRSF